MKIVIVGCGKVGSAIAKQLCAEGHQITIVDTDSERVRRLTESLDVMGIVGNGSSVAVFDEINIKAVDVFIAVTGSDELNLISCMFAKKASHAYTIARVRNPVYHNEIDYIKHQMDISTIINPELLAADEISKILRFPAASKIDTFANGRVRLIKIVVPIGNEMCGTALKDLHGKFNSNILICAVERNNDVTIPNGEFVFADGDIVTFLAVEKNADEFMKRIKLRTNPVKSALIVGGGTIGYYLTKNLIEHNIYVRLIEKNVEKCKALAEEFPKATILCADGTDRELLAEEGLNNVEALVALTNVDEENLLLSMFAKKRTNAKLVTKVNRFELDDIATGIDIGTVIYPKYMSCDQIVQTVRAMQNKAGNNIKTLYRLLDDRVEALEMEIKEHSAVTDVPLYRLKTRKNLLICCITRGDQIILPRGNDTIRVGDSVIVVSMSKGLNDISDIIE